MKMWRDLIYGIKRIRQTRAIILMYHQVCERRDDPWDLAVHPDHFDAQLSYLKRNFEVVPVSDLVNGIAERKMRKMVAISFDDGFKDNCINAAPLLDWHELPATFYVATSAMGTEGVYWWDALQDVIFNSAILPERLSMEVRGTPVRFQFRSDRVLNSRMTSQILAWNHNLPVPNERVELYLLLWQHIKPLGYAQQKTAMNEVREWAGHQRFISSRSATMSVREMQMLGENELFSIGAHSVNHSMLSLQNHIDQAFEVKESKRQIEKWLGKSVDGFAYPYGSFNELTQALIREAGFKYAVSTESKTVTSDDNPFALPRIQVKNWPVYEFAAKLNQLMND